MGSKAMENELVDLFEKAKRAADKAAIDEGPVEAEEQRCLEALTVLASLPVTMAALISSQISSRAAKLEKSLQKNWEELSYRLLS